MENYGDVICKNAMSRCPCSVQEVPCSLAATCYDNLNQIARKLHVIIIIVIITVIIMVTIDFVFSAMIMIILTVITTTVTIMRTMIIFIIKTTNKNDLMIYSRTRL